ncbi:MAG: hypothetical protein SOY27_08745 [Fournierella sp.]|uniref:hypothetical protein n=1 Tax=Allofournierella sp. TaxID=1940256 RepID=UPI002A835321|nr:hypothetical protein [Fournierella sp.]MDY4167557.1 hypothetical protein [Fournierella sp.]
MIASHLPGPLPGEGEPVCCFCWLFFSSVSGVFSKIASLTALLPCFYTSPIIARKGAKGQGFGSFFHTPFKSGGKIQAKSKGNTAQFQVVERAGNFL